MRLKRPRFVVSAPMHMNTALHVIKLVRAYALLDRPLEVVIGVSLQPAPKGMYVIEVAFNTFAQPADLQRYTGFLAGAQAATDSPMEVILGQPTV